MDKEDEDREDRALLAWLLEGRQDNDDHDPMLTEFLRESPEGPTADLNSELRDFGLSPGERRKALRSEAKFRPDSRHYKVTVFKQFRWWIDKRVDWSRTELNPDYVTAIWVNLTKYNLDLAKSWWHAGIDPLDLELIATLSEHNLHPRDLVISVSGRTILEHLRRGTSVEWCVNAKDWHRRRGA